MYFGDPWGLSLGFSPTLTVHQSRNGFQKQFNIKQQYILISIFIFISYIFFYKQLVFRLINGNR